MTSSDRDRTALTVAGLLALWPVALAGFVAFGMAQPWSWDDWMIPTLIVVVAGGFLAIGLLFDDQTGLAWAGWVAAVPPVLFAVGRFLPVYWDRAIWQTIDLVTVGCFLIVAVALVVGGLGNGRRRSPG